ncbi:hypothetical protein F5B17DRAFT_436031 [Nemania serpens]|nr:hypothetical protein F5B17DRAFT_436031 [Nemania serpens]
MARRAARPSRGDYLTCEPDDFTLPSLLPHFEAHSPRQQAITLNHGRGTSTSTSISVSTAPLDMPFQTKQAIREQILKMLLATTTNARLAVSISIWMTLSIGTLTGWYKNFAPHIEPGFRPWSSYLLNSLRLVCASRAPTGTPFLPIPTSQSCARVSRKNEDDHDQSRAKRPNIEIIELSDDDSDDIQSTQQLVCKMFQCPALTTSLKPPGFGIEIASYQLHAIWWMPTQQPDCGIQGGCLGDAMGLGKTIEVLSSFATFAMIKANREEVLSY